MLKFVIDEDMPRSTAKVLMDREYEVLDIRDHGLRGADDNTIYRFAQSNQAVLISGDMGFSNILHFPIGEHSGIVIVHFPNEISTTTLNDHLVARIKELLEEDFKGNVIIIEPGKMRIRRRSITP